MNAYFIKRSGNGEEFLKIGVTKKKNPEDRHNYEKTKLADSNLDISEKIQRMFRGETHVDDDSYPSIEKIWTKSFYSDTQALVLEDQVLTEFKKIQYYPKLKFSGKTECFIFSEANKATILSYIENIYKKIIEDSVNELTYAIHGMDIREQDPIKRHRLIIDKIKKRA